MKKGIFWCRGFDTDSPELITKTVGCDKDGASTEPMTFNSKSGQNFNHRLEWEKLDKKTPAGGRLIIIRVAG